MTDGQASRWFHLVTLPWKTNGESNQLYMIYDVYGMDRWRQCQPPTAPGAVSRDEVAAGSNTGWGGRGSVQPGPWIPPFAGMTDIGGCRAITERPCG